jgi:hypothetical protein
MTGLDRDNLRCNAEDGLLGNQRSGSEVTVMKMSFVIISRSRGVVTYAETPMFSRVLAVAIMLPGLVKPNL